MQHVAPLSLAPKNTSWHLEPVEYHGPDEQDAHYAEPGRYVLVIPGRDWPNAPTACSTAYPTEWIGDGEVLVCTGCGLDCS